MMIMRKPPVKQAAFSLVELLVVITVIGILIAVAAPRFTNDDTIEARALASQIIGELRFAQQLAMNNTEKLASVTINSNQLSVAQDGSALNNYPKSLGNAVTVSDIALTYNSLGSTTAGQIDFSPNPGFAVCVESTGYARLC